VVFICVPLLLFHVVARVGAERNCNTLWGGFLFRRFNDLRPSAVLANVKESQNDDFRFAQLIPEQVSSDAKLANFPRFELA